MKKLILAAALLAASTTTQAYYVGNLLDAYPEQLTEPVEGLNRSALIQTYHPPVFAEGSEVSSAVAPNTLAKFRAAYPGLASSSDAALANFMHVTDVPDMPEAEFYKSIGYDPSWVSRLGTLLNSHIKIVVSN